MVYGPWYQLFVRDFGNEDLVLNPEYARWLNGWLKRDAACSFVRADGSPILDKEEMPKPVTEAGEYEVRVLTTAQLPFAYSVLNGVNLRDIREVKHE